MLPVHECCVASNLLCHICCVTDPFTFMKDSDEAADTTLCELFGDICSHSSFDPVWTAIQLKNEGIFSDSVYNRCVGYTLSCCSHKNTRIKILNPLRLNGDPGVFQTFVAILESVPGNSSIVQKIKGNYMCML